MGHLEDVEEQSKDTREAAVDYARMVKRRNQTIARARGDSVSPKALAERSRLSPQQIRRICKEEGVE